MADSTGVSSGPPLSISCSNHFLGWLHTSGISLAVTTYQTNRLFLLGVKPDGTLSAFERLLDGAMGLSADSDRFYLATRYQIWQFDNALDPQDDFKGFDKLYVPRVAHTTGDLDTHDVAVDRDGRILFINSLYSCLATTSEQHSFSALWKPPFISKLSPEDRCHLNGLAMVDGVPGYVTAVSQSNQAAGWRENRHTGGCVIDVQSDNIIASGLSMPHSPRFYRGKLWLLNSGTGELGYLNRDTGEFEAVVFCPGYLRGLAFYDNYAVVALSKLRHNKVFTGLELDQRIAAQNAEPCCGVMIVDLTTGDIVHWLKFQGVVTELYDVQVLPGTRRPMALGLKSDEIKRLISFEEKGSVVLHSLSARTLPTSELTGQNEQVQTHNKPGEGYVYQASLNMTVSAALKDYAVLTFPGLQKQATARKIREPLMAIVATHQGVPIGLVLAEYSSSHSSAKVLSLFVQPAHRREGVGETLLSNMYHVAARQGCKGLEIAYQADWPNAIAMERMLRKHSWSAPRASMLLCKGTMQDIASADWLNKCSLPDDFEIFLWSELTAEERNSIIDRQKDEPWFPPVLTPFQEEERIEPLNSLGLRYRGEVVGWMITHRTSPDTVQYTSLFVRKDLQRPGRAIPLLAQAIKRQMASDIPKGICQIQTETRPMVVYMRRRFAPYNIMLKELQCAHKTLEPVPTETSARLTSASKLCPS